MVLLAFVHHIVELLDMTFKKFLFNWLNSRKCLVIFSNELVQLINASQVIFFLKRDVDNSLWDLFSYSVKELCFSNDNLELRREVNSIRSSFSIIFTDEDLVIFQKTDGFFVILLIPFRVDFTFILLIKFSD